MVSVGGTNMTGAVCWPVSVKINDVKLCRVCLPGVESGILVKGRRER